MLDLAAHLVRQMAFSRGTFGPGASTKRVINHIKKELKEVKEAEGDARTEEWADVVILGLEGLTRHLRDTYPDTRPSDIARIAVTQILNKQDKNEMRNWPDWRKSDPDKAVEHERGHHD